jgi:hypothetical protein
VTHETKHFIYFYLGKGPLGLICSLQTAAISEPGADLGHLLLPAGQVAILLFKSG